MFFCEPGLGTAVSCFFIIIGTYLFEIVDLAGNLQEDGGSNSINFYTSTRYFNVKSLRYEYFIVILFKN